ncbi:glycosyltransferase family 4 protein [Roseomonas sp. CAU 1739]|uniref:glycosyltransferase family 4 protein n=1 Tax=Roseomonas sp. CAU 1739 TaxID=3140364 RepID=UPI00325B2FA3
MTRPLPVLFTHFGEEWIRGSEQVLLDLLNHIDRAKVAPVVWCNGDALAGACRQMGLPTYQTPFEFYFDYNQPRFRPGRYLSLVREGIGIVRRHGIQVLHANGAAPCQWLVPVRTLTRRPLLVHLHIDYLRRSRYVLLLHMADLIVGVSRQVTDGFRDDGMPPERLKVIYNGLDFSRIPPARQDLRATLGIAPGAPVVATVGSLVRRKGHDLLLRAVAALPPGPPEAMPHLLVGSDGEVRGELEALAHELGIAERTHFLGYTDDIAAIYDAADIFALASRADAFGLVLAEAGHFGLPVVSTRVGGIPEVIVDGETGLLVPAEDVPALRDALGRLIGSADLRAEMGAAGRRRADELFAVSRMAGEFAACYRGLAEGTEVARPRATRFRPYAALLRSRHATTQDARRP